MVKKHHRQSVDFVEPDLPITPMLDMSFQLLAFFVFTFDPAPIEGQIAMSLPKEEGGEAIAMPNPADEKPEAFIVRVEAAGNGTISKISIMKKDDVVPTPVDLGADVAAYQKELKARYAAIQGAEAKAKAKVTLEIQENLLQEYVVQLLDNGIRSGFSNIAPVPLDPKKR
jgi:biopolymer transport protein ExbD